MNYSLLLQKKIICSAETPFQVFCLSVIFSSMDKSFFKQLDLVVYEQFVGLNDLIEILELGKLFDNIYVIKHEDFDNTRKNLRYLCNQKFNIAQMREVFFKQFSFFDYKLYDVLFCATPSCITHDIKNYCVPGGFTVFYDDGTGSHNGSGRHMKTFVDKVYNSSTTQNDKNIINKIEDWLVRLFFKKELLYNVAEIWLFNPSKLDREIYLDGIVQSIDFENSSLYKTIKHKALDDEEFGKYWFLSLTTASNSNELNREKEILKTITTYINTTINVRLHPGRSNDFGDRIEFNVKDSKILWELMSLKGVINNDSVLIGHCSTAQITPKLIFDLEPTLVFLYKLYSVDNDQLRRANRTVEDIKSRYINKSKIYVPENEAQLIDSLMKIS